MKPMSPEEKPAVVSAPSRDVRKDRIPTLEPVKICLIYLVFGILWIIFSDSFFLSLPLPEADIILISQIKGTLFILVTTILLYLLIQSFTRRMQAKNEDLEHSNKLIRDREEQLRIRNEEISRSEAEWETTYNAISDWISVVSPDGRILKSNKGIETILGMTAEEAAGKSCSDLVHGTSCPIDCCPRMSTLASKKRETVDVPKKGGCGWYQITVDPVLDAEGNVVSAVHIVRDISERMQEHRALEQAKKKLHLLNYVTFNEIQNAIFTLWGFHQYVKDRVPGNAASPVFAKEEELLGNISHSLKFAQAYQNLGLKSPAWQDVRQVFLMAISHMDFSAIRHTVELDDLEIFADPLLEQVFMILADNTIVHGKNATSVTLRYREGEESLTIFFEDDGAGIPESIKTTIFSPDFQKTKAIGLFLAREILEITGIMIHETGIQGTGARFEIIVPREAYRFRNRK